jgi:hypothetical protein
MIEPMPTTAADDVDLKAVNTMLTLARMRRSHKRAPFYLAAGQHLDHLRQGKHVEVFAELVRKHCGLGLSRAYELISLGRGKPLAELRAEKGKSKREKAKKYKRL